MAKKLVCSVTGNWQYCADDRFEKLRARFGSVDALMAGYVSREGQKILDANEGDRAKAIVAARGSMPKNKIACIVTGELMYISDERMAHLCKKYNTDIAGVRARYICRVANRVREELSMSLFKKLFGDCDATEKSQIDNEIRQRAMLGTLPAPAAPKGSKKNEPKVSKRAQKGAADKPATQVLDTVPAGTATPAHATV